MADQQALTPYQETNARLSKALERVHGALEDETYTHSLGRKELRELQQVADARGDGPHHRLVDFLRNTVNNQLGWPE